jgi:hypothetical protein
MRNYIKFILLTIGLLIGNFYCSSSIVTKTIKLKTECNYFMEIQDIDSIMICWDIPLWVSDTIKSYDLYYREFSDSIWKLLKSNIQPSGNPGVIIHHKDINSTDSLFYFGIECKSIKGITSYIHSSTDSTAIPQGGWLLIWRSKT